MNDRALEFFRKICTIPHPSGQEQELCEFLRRTADRAGLKTQVDKAGNLRIDRPASPGRENAPHILLQAHMDMVPQKSGDSAFDFTVDPIPLIEEDGWLRSAAETTLGADDGVGVAAAMSILLDKELAAGPLTALFTVNEEVGLSGAAALTPEMLAGDYLYNLDSEEEGIFYVGCAGGVRMRSELTWEPDAPHLNCGVKIRVTGLPGGHSGTDIARPRGNAILAAARLASGHAFELADFVGGKQDNAIPREATLFGVTTPEDFEAMTREAAMLTDELRRDLEKAPSAAIEITSAPRPMQTASIDRSHEILTALAEVPNGAENFDAELGIVDTSSNLAALSSPRPGVLQICSSQRSLTAAGRDAMNRKVAEHFAAVGALNRTDNAYSPWEREKNSRLAEVAREVYGKLFKSEAKIAVIPAGLECGIFKGIAPKLEMISFGPTLENVHSPTERLNLESFRRFYRFLHTMVENPPRR